MKQVMMTVYTFSEIVLNDCLDAEVKNKVIECVKKDINKNFDKLFQGQVRQILEGFKLNNNDILVGFNNLGMLEGEYRVTILIQKPMEVVHAINKMSWVRIYNTGNNTPFGELIHSIVVSDLELELAPRKLELHIELELKVRDSYYMDVQHFFTELAWKFMDEGKDILNYKQENLIAYANKYMSEVLFTDKGDVFIEQ